MLTKGGDCKLFELEDRSLYCCIDREAERQLNSVYITSTKKQLLDFAADGENVRKVDCVNVVSWAIISICLYMKGHACLTLPSKNPFQFHVCL